MYLGYCSDNKLRGVIMPTENMDIRVQRVLRKIQEAHPTVSVEGAFSVVIYAQKPLRVTCAYTTCSYSFLESAVKKLLQLLDAHAGYFGKISKSKPETTLYKTF